MSKSNVSPTTSPVASSAIVSKVPGIKLASGDKWYPASAVLRIVDTYDPQPISRSIVSVSIANCEIVAPSSRRERLRTADQAWLAR